MAECPYKGMTPKTERRIMRLIDELEDLRDTEEQIAAKVREWPEDVLTELLWAGYAVARDSWMARRARSAETA